jgi:hypothetical protein
MRLLKAGLFSAFVVVCITLIPAHVAYAQVAPDEVRGTLDSLSAWLATSDRGATWHEFLRTSQLEEQLAQGRNADKAKVEEVLAVYSSNTPGLSNAHFRAVRDALQAWVDELSLPPQDALAEMAATAAESFQPIEPEQLAEAKEELEKQAAQFESFIQRGGPDREEGWKTFLRWDDFQEELSADAPRLHVLTQIWGILASDQPGLENSRFVALREALRNYVELAEVLDGEKHALSALPQALETYVKQSNEQSAADLGLLLGWLERTGQGDDVVQAIRHHYSQPNFFVRGSERLATYGFVEDVNEPERINEYRDGNQITGNSVTTGKTTASLVPNGKQGEIVVHMDGVANSRTQSYNPNGVWVNTTGVTQIDANKSVFFNDKGISTAPAVARCETDNTVTSIRANSAQVESVARQRVAQNHRSNELRAARASEDRVERNLNQRVGDDVREANLDLQENFYAPMARRGIIPRLIKYRSSDTSLFGTQILAAPEHLAASGPVPSFDAQGDVVAQVHASWINNLADAMLRGAVMSDIGVAETLKEWRGEVPEELQVTDTTQPWDITLATRRPFWVEIGDNTLKITLRGDRFTAGDRTQNERMNIWASYKVQRDGDQIKLVRDGDVHVEFPDQGEKLSVRFVTLRRFWQTKFNAMFEPEFDDLSLRLRGAWESAGPLELHTLKAGKDGWLGLAWDMPNNPPETPAATAAQ